MSSPGMPIPPGVQGVAIWSDSSVAALDIPVEWMEFCSYCNDERMFFANRDCPYGLIAHCTSCGRERVVPFTRTTSEVA
jgi:hypothetical protein